MPVARLEQPESSIAHRSLCIDRIWRQRHPITNGNIRVTPISNGHGKIPICADANQSRAVDDRHGANSNPLHREGYISDRSLRTHYLTMLTHQSTNPHVNLQGEE